MKPDYGTLDMVASHISQKTPVTVRSFCTFLFRLGVILALGSVGDYLRFEGGPSRAWRGLALRPRSCANTGWIHEGQIRGFNQNWTVLRNMNCIFCAWNLILFDTMGEPQSFIPASFMGSAG